MTATHFVLQPPEIVQIISICTGLRLLVAHHEKKAKKNPPEQAGNIRNNSKQERKTDKLNIEGYARYSTLNPN